MRYAFIERHREVWPIVVQCRVLEVSASGYRRHRVRRTAPAASPGQRVGDVALLVHVRAIFHEMKGPVRGPNWTRFHRLAITRPQAKFFRERIYFANLKRLSVGCAEVNAQRPKSDADDDRAGRLQFHYARHPAPQKPAPPAVPA